MCWTRTMQKKTGAHTVGAKLWNYCKRNKFRDHSILMGLTRTLYMFCTFTEVVMLENRFYYEIGEWRASTKIHYDVQPKLKLMCFFSLSFCVYRSKIHKPLSVSWKFYTHNCSIQVICSSFLFLFCWFILQSDSRAKWTSRNPK